MQNSHCISCSLSIMIACGLWPPKSMADNYWRFAYYVYSIIYHLLFFFPVLFIEFIYFYLVSDSVENIAAASLLLLTHVSQLLKICIYWFRRDGIRKLLVRIDDPIFHRMEPEKKEILENSGKSTLKISKYFFMLVFTTGIFWGTYPLLKPVLTLPLNYPYITSENPIFWYIYMFEIVSMTMMGIAVASMDFLIGGLMSIAASQLELLSYEISSIGCFGTLEQKSNSFTQNEDRDYKQLVSCVKFHLNIISLVKEMERLFGLPLFFQFLLSSIIICVTAFRATVSSEPLELVTMLFYLMCVSSELLLFCYYGDILKRKSELVLTEAYCSNWYKASLRAQKVLILLMIRTEKPLVLTAGKLFELSLMTYSTILKTSYSFFSVLNNSKHT